MSMHKLIFNHSSLGRYAKAQAPRAGLDLKKQLNIPQHLLRKTPPQLPACSELQVIRHYTKLSQKNFCIDTNFYPLGSCTMKYNPRGVHEAAMMPGFLNLHPLAQAEQQQGTLEILYHLQNQLADITGMQAVSLAPMAGAQGEFSGVAMIKAYHSAHGETHRNEMLIPDAAHGTNPASAVTCGFKVIEIPTLPNGQLDLALLKEKVGPHTAGIMLTNPSTLGLFMEEIKSIADIIHHAGGLLYYDGANLNAILGQVRPGDMGFDVMHLNCHKTFATPHGGGGPGAGPVAANEKLAPYLPTPLVYKKSNLIKNSIENRTSPTYHLLSSKDRPQSIGKLSAFFGNTGILLRAYFYIKLLGQAGLKDVSNYATLNANYLLKSLQKVGYKAPYPNRRASHEFIVTLKEEKASHGISAVDVAKRLIDYGFHPPTTYFPLLIPECLLIEPTETECKADLDAFVEAMSNIKQEAQQTPEVLLKAPQTRQVSRLDEVMAAKNFNFNYFYTNNQVQAQQK